MFYRQNKKLIWSAAAVLALWLAVQWGWTGARWAEADETQRTAEEDEATWDKYFAPGPNMLRQDQAGQKLKSAYDDLHRTFEQLRKIELGTPEQLAVYTVAGAGSSDHNNYLATLRTRLAARAKDEFQVDVSSLPELGISDKAAEDPVSVNLIRLAAVERFLLACKEAKVTRLTKIKYDPPHLLLTPDMLATEAGHKDGKAAAKSAPVDAPEIEKLVQFPMKVLLVAPESAFGQLLYELQRPSDGHCGYFEIRGFHVTVRDAASGNLEAAVALSALLNEKDVAKLGIELKAAERVRHARPDLNGERY